MTRAWSAVYVHLHRDRDRIDAFLLDHLAPDAEELVSAGLARAWFFLRYWDGGPHLRVRFLDADADAVRGFAERMRAAARKTAGDAVELRSSDYYARLPQADPDRWHDDGDVVDAVYEPETGRYGGPGALEVCEDFFCVSTRISLAVLRAAPRPDQRLVVAADLTALAFGVLGFSDAEAVGQTRGYYYGWDYSAEVTRGDDRAREAAEQLFHSSPSRWSGRRDRVERLVAAEGDSTHHLWHRALRETVERLRGMELTNDLTRIVWSLLHMTHNRLGLDIEDECLVAWLLSLAYPRREPPGDYFSPELTAPDRVYAEASKYRAETIGDAHLPRPVPAQRPLPPAMDAAVVGLPDPGPLTAELGEVLARRSSAHGDYGSYLALADLSRLLAHAAGTSTARAGGFGRPSSPAVLDGRPPAAAPAVPSPSTGPRRRAADSGFSPRNHPSPGAAYATEVHVVARHVDGLAPGTYRYLAEEHALLRTDGPRDAERLAGLSPFLREEADGRPGAVADTVGALVILVGDVGRLRTGYGQRALRLLLQEAGHVAQNLTLCATALGLRSLVVSGFVDDAVHSLLHVDGVDRVALTLVPVGAPDR